MNKKVLKYLYDINPLTVRLSRNYYRLSHWFYRPQFPVFEQLFPISGIRIPATLQIVILDRPAGFFDLPFHLAELVREIEIELSSEGGIGAILVK